MLVLSLMKHLSILGHSSKLSLAELRAVYGPDVDLHTSSTATFDGDIYQHLGGSSKVGQLITTLPTNDIDAIVEYLHQELASQLDLPESKFNLGISFYGGKIDNYQAICLSLKKQLRQEGYKPRVVLAKNQELSSAQVIHNSLVEDNDYEILISIGKSDTFIARTTWVQDIDSYTHRDMDRPCRDMQTGMLPPKLAQIMINLAGGEYIFDPFCGSGVILQEALLMGKKTGGSDIDSKMINCSRQNLDWLSNEFNTAKPQELGVVDAREVKLPQAVDTIVTEGYLGPIIKTVTSKDELEKLASESSELMKAVLINIKNQLPANSKLCLALPAWKSGSETILPEIIDNIEALGYNRLLLNKSDTGLLYRREDQFVGRYIILLETISNE